LSRFFAQSGGFYSAEDADSLPTADATKKREGAFCVWSSDEVRELLHGAVTATSGADVDVADIVCFHYDIRPNGNVEAHKARIKLIHLDTKYQSKFDLLAAGARFTENLRKNSKFSISFLHFFY